MPTSRSSSTKTNAEYQRDWHKKNPGRRAKYNKKWRDDHPEEYKSLWRKYRLKRDFNLTPEEYAIILKKQNNTCAICKQPPKKNVLLCVDHCHKTLKNRGLLCHGCNLALGYIKENKKALANAIEYLKEFDNAL